jgi:hypothetical protein
MLLTVEQLRMMCWGRLPSTSCSLTEGPHHQAWDFDVWHVCGCTISMITGREGGWSVADRQGLLPLILLYCSVCNSTFFLLLLSS